jgi:aminomethyltransferase
MKKTALFNTHVALGAKIVPFAGYEMPVSYSGINEEHFVVREKAGMFDVSHMGQFFLEGENAKALIQKVTTNQVEALVPGKAQYSCLPNNEGGIVDDLIVYMLAENNYMLVVNASNIEKDWNWISQFNDLGVKMTNASDDMSLIAVQGPKAVEILQKLTDTNLSEIPYYHFAVGTLAGQADVILSNTGYTGSGGFELYVKNEIAEKIWAEVSKAGEAEGILPCGLAARDTLRLEKGFCLYGNDINDTTSPIEAGLGWITKFDKEFTAKEIIAQVKADGPKRKLVGFEMLEKAIPRHDYIVVDAAGNEIGVVTSGTMSPMKKIGLGLAYVAIEHSKVDSEIFIQIRNKNVAAKVAKYPFV